MSRWQHVGAFVVRFTSQTDVTTGVYEGRIEHVASGRSLHFNSLDELVEFMESTLKQAELQDNKG
jgi:hypothetical protein